MPEAKVKPLELVTLLGTEIERRRTKRLEEQIQKRPRHSSWASSIPDCTRRGYYEIVEWDKKRLHDAHLQARFEKGHAEEDILVNELSALGFEVVERQAYLEKSLMDRYKISGKIDGKIVWEGRRVPFEVKSMAPNVFDRLKNLPHDLILQHMRESWYMKNYIKQMQVYLLGHNEEAGLFFFTDLKGHWKIVPVQLDLEIAEEVLQKVEAINEAVKTKKIPPRIDYDSEICGRCPFAHVCLPDVLNDPKIMFSENKDLERKLERRAELEPAAKEFGKIDKEVKATLRGQPLVVVGTFTVEGKPQKRRTVELPADLKAKYTVIKESWVTKITRSPLAGGGGGDAEDTLTPEETGQ